MTEDIIRTEYDLLFGDRYRQAPKGDSSPLVQKWIDFETQRKEARRKGRKATARTGAKEPAATPVDAATEATPTAEAVTFTERDEALIKAFNEHYGPSLPSGKRHPTFTEETSHWMCWVCDNDPVKAIAMSYRLDWVNDWNPNPGEVEDLINTASKKKLLTRCPKALKELLQKDGIDNDHAAAGHKVSTRWLTCPSTSGLNRLSSSSTCTLACVKSANLIRAAFGLSCSLPRLP